MGETSELTILEVLLFGMLGMFSLATAIIVFFISYQRRLLKQQRKLQEAETLHQKELLNATVKSQEQERNRLAKDLHDDIGALLNTVRLYTGQIDSTQSKEEVQQLKQKTNELLDETIQSVRRISHDLHPIILKNLGLVEAIYSLVKKISDSGEISIDFQHEDGDRLAYEQELTLYRITQELVTNTLKHAKASSILIRLSRSETTLILDYKDNGVGYDPASLKRDGLGLKNIESRLTLVNGTVNYLETNAGSSVKVEMPINGDHQSSDRRRP